MLLPGPLLHERLVSGVVALSSVPGVTHIANRNNRNVRTDKERAHVFGGVRMKKMAIDLRIHHQPLKTAITRSKAFERKKLAQYSANVGTKCAHGCTYCSSGAVLRHHQSFQAAGENPYESGYAIIDSQMPEKVANAAERKRKRGLVMLCTTTDAWDPVAQEHHLGRRCLEAILAQPGWTVRVLTKNAAVVEDLDVIARHRDRVLVGISLTGTPDKEEVLKIIEPNASPILERISALRKAHRMGFRTYAMLCPLLPGIADRRKEIRGLVQIVKRCGVEEIFVEPVNPRGKGLPFTEQTLREAGRPMEADRIAHVRRATNWSAYAVRLVADVQQVMRQQGMADRFKFLLYGSRLAPQDAAQIRKDNVGVVWLSETKDTKKTTADDESHHVSVRMDVRDARHVKARLRCRTVMRTSATSY